MESFLFAFSHTRRLLQLLRESALQGGIASFNCGAQVWYAVTCVERILDHSSPGVARFTEPGITRHLPTVHHRTADRKGVLLLRGQLISPFEVEVSATALFGEASVECFLKLGIRGPHPFRRALSLRLLDDVCQSLLLLLLDISGVMHGVDTRQAA